MGYLSWTYAGVNHSIDGVGGPECLAYLSGRQRLAETLPALLLAAYQLRMAARAVTLPRSFRPSNSNHVDLRLLGMFHALIFGIEIGYKLSTNTLIWLLNPCHVITVIQIILLMLPPSRLATGLFRLMIHLLNGPLLALLLPVVNTRLLTGEVLVYYVQHVYILALPLFLIRHGDVHGVYTTEPLMDFSWVVLSQALQNIYHFTVLQPIACLTAVNLDNIICPAISDPFRGQYYRMWAVFHQTMLTVLLGKALTCAYRLALMKADAGACGGDETRLLASVGGDKAAANGCTKSKSK